MRLPTDKEIQKVLSNITDDDYSIVMAYDVNAVDRVKFKLCEQFVIYPDFELVVS